MKHGFLNIRHIKQVARDTIKQFDVRTDGIDQLTSSCRGNQQKLIIGRTLLHQSNIIVAAQPTRGVDIGTIEYMPSASHAEMRGLRFRHPADFRGPGRGHKAG